jgi:hypothetical protein
MTETYYSIEYLTSKIKSWTPEHATTFHTSEEKAYPEKAKYIWEAANTDITEGVVHYGPNFATYYSAAGDEYALTSVFWPAQFATDWKASRLLYQRSVDPANGFKILNPIGFNEGYNMGSYDKVGIYKTIEIDEKVFVYYKLKHPNNMLGSNHRFSVTPEQRLHFFVDNLATLLSNITELLKTNTEITGYPSIKYAWLCTSNGQPYWRMLYEWEASVDTIFAQSVGELQKYIQNEEKNGYTIPAGIENYAREEWKKALSI